MKKIAFGILIIFLTSCGFTPIYKNDIINKFNLEVIKAEGDLEINNHIKYYLNKYIDKSLEKKIKISMKTSYSKKSISKDSEGKITSYTLSATTIFDISFDKKTKEVTISRRLSLDRLEDSFEQKRYETKIKKDLALSIKNGLMTELLTTK
jgi:hypothetical protein